MHVTAIPALADNYAWLLRDDDGAVVIDPSESAPVLAALDGARLRAILCTHHHWDHVGGIEDLRKIFGAIDVVGSRHDVGRIPHQTIAVGEGDTVGGARVIEVPGHTLGAVAYVREGWVFTGDTLFAAGCGRLFEGTPAQMRASLAKLRELDPATMVACGHEYTVKNLEFALHLTPDDTAVAERLAWARAARAEGRPTVPSTIGEERQTNPFLRWDDPALVAAGARIAPGDDVFATLRAAKDWF